MVLTLPMNLLPYLYLFTFDRQCFSSDHPVVHFAVVFLTMCFTYLSRLPWLPPNTPKKLSHQLHSKALFGIMKKKTMKTAGGTLSWTFHLCGELIDRLKRLHQGEFEIIDKECLCIRIAGLCHDLGHGPFISSCLYDSVLQSKDFDFV